jgi:hypothetical protein
MMWNLKGLTAIKRLWVVGLMGFFMSPVFALSPPAPELKYMSPKCVSMLEAQRTASNAVRQQPSFAELRRNYQEQCSENQSEARQRLYEEKRKNQQQTAEQEREMKKQQLLSDNAAKLKSSQCMEMRDALESRKRRTHMTDGEIRDLGLFETRYKERCP